MFALAPTTPSTSFLQPLMRLLVCSTDFTVSPTGTMAMSSQWYCSVPSLAFSCSPLSWSSGLGGQGLFFPSASYHTNKNFVTILQIPQTQKLTGVLQGCHFRLPWSYRWDISVLLLTAQAHLTLSICDELTIIVLPLQACIVSLALTEFLIDVSRILHQ